MMIVVQLLVMKFSYQSIAQDSEHKKGLRDADDKFALARMLKAEGEMLIMAEEVKSSSISLKIPFLTGVKIHEKIIFTRNLASMLEAGLPVSRALSVIERQLKNKTLKDIVIALNENIRIGKTLSEGMKLYPDVFPPLCVSMVASGEETGQLSEALSTVSSQMEKTYLLKKKIQGALLYPCIILIAMLCIGIFMLVYIVPTLTNTFKSLGTDLPASTQFIISASDLFQTHMVLIFLSFLIIGFLVFIFSKTSSGKRFVDFVLLHIPVISPLVKETNSARTTRTLSSLLSAGVSVVEAINITKDVIQNSYYKEVLEQAKHNIETGSPIAEVFAQAEHLYPVFVGEMIAVGEETGDLGSTLLKVAIFYETEVEQKTKDMSTIVEPVLMLIVGVAVGFFAISMISPIYSVVDKI